MLVLNAGLAGITTSKKKNDRNRDALIQDVSLLSGQLRGRYTEPRRPADRYQPSWTLLEAVTMSSPRRIACLAQDRRTCGPDSTLAHPAIGSHC